MYKINRRKLILMFADIFVIGAAGALCIMFILAFGIEGYPPRRVILGTALGAFFSYFCLTIQGAYNILWRYFKPKEYLRCVFGTFGGVAISAVVCAAVSKPVGPLFWIIFFLSTAGGTCLFRLLFRRAFLYIAADSKKMEDRKRTLIVGGGQACYIILAEMGQEDCEYEPVCIVDDDVNKMRTQIRNIMIRGTTEDIPKLCELEKIETIVFAIVKCEDEERRRILDICNSTGLEIKIVPRLSDAIFNSGSLLSQADSIKIEDLLGRDSVSFDDTAVRELVGDRICMVTGGGGSIGSELCRQLASYHPKQLIILDIYENNAYDIQQELILEYGRELDLVTIIASVRDYAKLSDVFKQYRPEIVFHAAAHKHVPLMETVPEEAVKNNIFGTFNVASLSDFYKVKKFVMISTDKAVNPTNVMGATKRCCEMVVQYMAQNSINTEYVAVRFGNVLGSNGSVIPLFVRQIKQGKPVTVTHPEITRFFMTISEAVSLVLQAASMASGGEIFVLDMGKPVKIVHMAENLIRMYGKKPYTEVPIEFTGLRPGEKLYEELMMNEEGLKNTSSKRIFIGNQTEIDAENFPVMLERLKRAAEHNNSAETVRLLEKIVPTFNHNGGEKEAALIDMIN